MKQKSQSLPGRGALAARSSASIEALLQLARVSFGRDGYHGTSLEAVAAQAGMTKGAVYHHFGSKLALFERVFQLEHRRTIDVVMTRSRTARDPIDALLRGARAYLQVVLDPIARRILLDDGPAVLGWERWRKCEEPGFQKLLEISLAGAAEQGLLRAGVKPAESAVLLLGAMTEGALAVAHSDTPAATARRLSDELATLVRALCAR